MASNNNRLTRTQRSFINDGTNPPLMYRNAALLAAPQQIVDTSTLGINIYGYNIINPNAVTVFVKLYNAQGVAPVVGVATPITTIMVPPSGSVVLKGSDVLYRFDNSCWVACVTGSADNNNTAPGTGVIIEIIYPTLNL